MAVSSAVGPSVGAGSSCEGFLPGATLCPGVAEGVALCPGPAPGSSAELLFVPSQAANVNSTEKIKSAVVVVLDIAATRRKTCRIGVFSRLVNCTVFSLKALLLGSAPSVNRLYFRPSARFCGF